MRLLRRLVFFGHSGPHPLCRPSSVCRRASFRQQSIVRTRPQVGHRLVEDGRQAEEELQARGLDVPRVRGMATGPKERTHGAGQAGRSGASREVEVVGVVGARASGGVTELHGGLGASTASCIGHDRVIGPPLLMGVAWAAHGWGGVGPPGCWGVRPAGSSPDPAVRRRSLLGRPVPVGNGNGPRTPPRMPPHRSRV